MTIRELHKRLGEIIADNDESSYTRARNDLPVYFETFRSGRKQSYYTPIKYASAIQLGIKTNYNESLQVVCLKGHECDTLVPSKNGFKLSGK